MKKKVNFFIVGAPKCGTTAFANALNDHSEVFIPSVKEPHFFCDDWPSFRRYSTLAQYESIYENGQFWGDASVWYLYSDCAHKNIKKYNGEAKIIIFLREPWDMLPSLHNQLVFSGREPEKDFNRAWARDDNSLKKISTDKAIVREHLNYKENGFYYENVKKYVDEFGEKNVLVVFFEDIKHAPEAVLKNIFSFIGLKSEHVEVKKDNAARRHRFPWLTGFIINPPPIFKSIKKALKKIIFRDQGKSYLRRFYSVMSVPAERSNVAPSAKKEMLERFGSDWDKVRKTYGKI